MEALKERIRREGRVLPGNIIKVDGFLNHRVDTAFMEELADEFARYFDVSKITMVLTAEASGIALATICANKYGVPMVFAKKAKSDNIEGGLYQSEIFSYTYKKKATLIVAQEWLGPEDKVLIIDDFMAKGYAMQGLIDIVHAAGAELVGIGVAVEKGFQHGGDRLREAGAREVHWLPLYCKKGRPGWQLQVICTHEDIERLQTIIFLETTTNGIRRQVMERVCLSRRFERVTTPWGEVSVKVATLPDGSERAAPEYEDCARLAREHNVPLQRVMQAAQAAALQFE